MTPEELQKIDELIRKSIGNPNGFINQSLEHLRVNNLGISNENFRARVKMLASRTIIECVDRQNRKTGTGSAIIQLKGKHRRRNIYYAIDPEGRILPEEIVLFIRQEAQTA